jgi:hypothetical protein
MVLALTFRSFTSTLLPQRTMGMFSQTRVRSPGWIVSKCRQLFGVGLGRRTMPVGHILVCDARGNIEHDDTALAVNVVAITETTELLLAGGIPDVELNLTEVLRMC